jgi:hypothetical protein
MFHAPQLMATRLTLTGVCRQIIKKKLISMTRGEKFLRALEPLWNSVIAATVYSIPVLFNRAALLRPRSPAAPLSRRSLLSIS